MSALLKAQRKAYKEGYAHGLKNIWGLDLLYPRPMKVVAKHVILSNGTVVTSGTNTGLKPDFALAVTPLDARLLADLWLAPITSEPEDE